MPKGHETDLPSVKQLAEFHAAVISKLPRELTPKQIRYWLGHKSVLQRSLNDALKIVFLTDPDVFPVTVDYGKSLDEMIKAGGYDWTNDNITAERFPVKGEGAVERKLVFVHLDRDATTDEVLSEMKRRGLKPAAIEDLMAFGAKYPDEQREFPIIGLASSWVRAVGRRCFPYLDGDGGGRRLHLHWDWDVNRWGRDCRFLALCE